jgi:hypothetical protein
VAWAIHHAAAKRRGNGKKQNGGKKAGHEAISESV